MSTINTSGESGESGEYVQKKLSVNDWWVGMKQGDIGIQSGNIRFIYQYDLDIDKFSFSSSNTYRFCIIKKEDYHDSRKYFLFKSMEDYISWIKTLEDPYENSNDFSEFKENNLSWSSIIENQQKVIQYYNETSSVFKEQKFQTELVL